MTEYDYWLYLACVKDKLYNIKLEQLLMHFSGAEEIYRANEKELKAKGILNEKEIEILLKHKHNFDIDEMKENMSKKGIKFSYYNDEMFPTKLKQIPMPPMVLFYKGSLPPNDDKTVAMVGARVCTEYGKNIAYELAKKLAAKGISVVSGLARGIDTLSHKGCIDGGGATYAVLGCGVDICYPRENIELFERILYKGGIVSEYMPGSEPLAYRFPERNRIIAGLSETVIMVEAKERSGSFITVDHGLEQGKNIYAVPGRLTDPLSVGCNKLITEGAFPLVSVEQILLECGIEEGERKKQNSKVNKKNNFVLEKEYEVLYSCFGLVPKSIDDLVNDTGMEIGKVYEGILYLQMNDLCREVSKGLYTKISDIL